MKVSKLVEGLGDVLDMGKKKKKKAALKALLAKMKGKDVALKKAIAAASGKEKKRLQSAFAVNRAHRKKGVKELRKLKGKG